MGATYERRGRRSWRIVVHAGGQRERKTIHGTEQDAKDLVKWIHKRELAGINMVETLQKAQAAPAPGVTWPRLRHALPPYIIDEMVAKGEWTGSTPIAYRRRLATHVYEFTLSDGRKLGDLPVDQVEEPMIGAVLDHVRRTPKDGHGTPKSLALQEQIRSPLRRFYRDLIRKHGFTGANPAADPKDYMSKQPSKRARHGRITYFRQEEGPQLFSTCGAAFPRWRAFIGCCTLGGLRWGEAAGLEREDIDWKASVIQVRRSVCDKTAQVKVCKDGEDRFVPCHVSSPSGCVAILRPRRSRANSRGGRPSSARVFPNSRGKIGRYSTFLEHVWQPLLLKAGLRYRKAHSMRHTFATWALEGNEEKGIQPSPILAVRDWMGHASVQETEGYLHRSRASHARTVNNLDAYVR